MKEEEEEEQTQFGPNLCNYWCGDGDGDDEGENERGRRREEETKDGIQFGHQAVSLLV